MTTIDGRIFDSQTVILSVIAEDGFMELPAQGGDTLAEIGADYGLPKEVISDANPLIDPDLPLQDGQPINIPIVSDAPKVGDNGKEEDGNFPPNIPLITWQFKPLEPVDKSYCYLSSGNGKWTKFPKQPFDFLFGSSVEYIQHDNIPVAGKTVLQIQCWGWLGDTLKFLGQGETPFDPLNGDMPLVVVGKGFQLRWDSQNHSQRRKIYRRSYQEYP